MIDDDGDDESEDVEDEGSGKWAFLTVGDVESMDVLQVKEALQERGLGAEGNLKKLQKRLVSALANEDNLILASEGDWEAAEEEDDTVANKEWRRQNDERWGPGGGEGEGHDDKLVGVQSYLGSLDKGDLEDSDTDEEVLFEVEGTEEEKKTLLKRLYRMQIGWFAATEEAKGWRPAGVFTPRLRRKKRKRNDAAEVGWGAVEASGGAGGLAADASEDDTERSFESGEERNQGPQAEGGGQGAGGQGGANEHDSPDDGGTREGS
jgi:hypothetical protein